MAVPPDQLPPPQPAPPAVREAARQILARPEFRPPPKSLYQRAIEWLQEALGRAVSALVSGGRSGLIAWLAVAVVVAVIVLLVARIVTTTRRDPAARAERFSVVVDRRRPAVDWEREADEHAAAGRWRDAVRCRYRALVARLAAAGAVDEVPGRTAGEYRLEVRRSRPDAAPAFGDVTEAFERTWYGHRPASEDEDRRVRALAGEVLDEARR